MKNQKTTEKEKEATVRALSAALKHLGFKKCEGSTGVVTKTSFVMPCIIIDMKDGSKTAFKKLEKVLSVYNYLRDISGTDNELTLMYFDDGICRIGFGYQYDSRLFNSRQKLSQPSKNALHTTYIKEFFLLTMFLNFIKKPII